MIYISSNNFEKSSNLLWKGLSLFMKSWCLKIARWPTERAINCSSQFLGQEAKRGVESHCFLNSKFQILNSRGNHSDDKQSVCYRRFYGCLEWCTTCRIVLHIELHIKLHIKLHMWRAACELQATVRLRIQETMRQVLQQVRNELKMSWIALRGVRLKAIARLTVLLCGALKVRLGKCCLKSDALKVMPVVFRLWGSLPDAQIRVLSFECSDSDVWKGTPRNALNVIPESDALNIGQAILCIRLLDSMPSVNAGNGRHAFHCNEVLSG